MKNNNPFYEGQKVVCIKDSFPNVKTTNEDKSKIGKLAVIHPKLNEVLIIDEILGDFIRFDKYDIHDPEHPEFGWQWWHYSAFAPADEIMINKLVEELINENIYTQSITVSPITTTKDNLD